MPGKMTIHKGSFTYSQVPHLTSSGHLGGEGKEGPDVDLTGHLDTKTNRSIEFVYFILRMVHYS